MRNGFLALAAVMAATGFAAAQTPCESCDSGPRVYGSADYLLFWTKDAPTALPLLSSGTAASQGVVGVPGTTVLFGGSPFDLGTFNGLRVTAGVANVWGRVGFEGSGFLLERQSVGVVASANAFDRANVLARPVYNPSTGLPSSTGVHFMTNVPVTGYNATVSSQLWGAEANGTYTLTDAPERNVRVLAGFRYLDLDESIKDRTIIQAIETFGNFVPGTVVDSVSEFRGRSQFYGAQVGLDGDWTFGRVALNLRAKLAAGVSHDLVSVGANQVQYYPNGTQVVSADSVTARTSNLSSTTKDVFAVVPELGGNVGYDLTDHLRLRVGFQVLYWSAVVRPGEQIDPYINLNRSGPPIRPIPLFNQSGYWAHGVNFGATWKF